MLKYFPPMFGLYAAGVMLFFWIVAMILKRYNFKASQYICRLISIAAMAYLIFGTYTALGKPYNEAGVRYAPSGVTSTEVDDAVNSYADIIEMPIIRDSDVYHKDNHPEGVAGLQSIEYRVVVFDEDRRANIEIYTFEESTAAKTRFTESYTHAARYIAESEKEKLGFVLTSGINFDACVLPVGYDAKRFLFGDFTSDDGTILRIFIRYENRVIEITENTDSYTVPPYTIELFNSTETLTSVVTTVAEDKDAEG